MFPTAQDHEPPDTTELPKPAASSGWVLEFGSASGSVRVSVSVGQSMWVGSSASAEVTLDDRSVSSRHCRVEATESGLVIEDAGSKNGLLVGGARVPRATLRAGSAAFVVGSTSVSVEPEGESPLPHDTRRIPGLVGDSAPMLRLAEEIWRIAPYRVPVLIQGESGTGKDLVARALHQLADRSGQFVPVNAAAIPESLADAELFGHQKGAFTGALYNRPGAFEQADRGTLFLDEVAELSPALQVRLLRVVEDGRVRPIGARQERQMQVRIVSATWADLEERVRSGRFREDLLHRLATVVLSVPPLRDRKSDIAMLAKCLLARFEGELGPRALSPRFLARLVEYDWPGNVRQLSSVLYRAALRSNGSLLEPQHLELGRVGTRRTPNALLKPSEARELYEQHGKNISAAARAARVPRSTFRGWLERWRAEHEHPAPRAPDASVKTDR